MMDSPVGKKAIFTAMILSLLICLIIFFSNYFDERTKIVFCDVGQGDGIYLRIKNKVDVLIDAGSDQRVLSCLGKYMPFWDHKIEIAMLTHPDHDHYGGFIFLIDRYQIGKFIVNTLSNKSVTYQRLREKIINKKIKIEFYYAGDSIAILGDSFNFYWPPRGFTSVKDNDLSFISVFQENNFRTLFTGDATPFALSRLLHSPLVKVNILQVPHHGSKNGLIKSFLDLADPSIAVISVGKNNSYGHPHRQILDMLKAKNLKILRTDEAGDIIFKL